MAVGLTESTDDRVDHGSDTALDNMATGTFAMIFDVADVANNFRFWGGKGTPLQIFRRAVDGTRIAFSRATSATGMVVDVATGNVHAGVNLLAFAWDFTNSIAAYWGDLANIPTDKSSGANVGSGTLDTDAAQPFTVGANPTASANLCAPLEVSWAALWDVEFTLAEVQLACCGNRGGPLLIRPGNNLFFSHYGLHGTGTQLDLGPSGNHGTPTGAVQADHAPILIRRPQIVVPAAERCLVPTSDVSNPHGFLGQPGAASTNLYTFVDNKDDTDRIETG